jgi:hypothetical protein
MRTALGAAGLLASGHGVAQAVFPLVAAVIALVFAIRLGDLVRRKRRPQDCAWLVAMLMFAAASFAMFLGVLLGWTQLEFRVYWLFGAVLNVPFLFAGEAYLLFRRRPWAHLVLGVTVALSVFASIVVLGAPIDEAALSETLPLGKDVFGSSLAHTLAQIYGNVAYGLLLAGLLWSMFRIRGHPELRDQMTGILLIAVGASVVAVGSGIGAAFGIVVLFSAGLAAGVGIMFAGFLRASRPRATV